ncbi:MAG: GNAT family N-acetyltransferase [Octadecabacter sp.]|nr:GNAT family N-acetyltransferase [Octadecabacter sp.]
MVNEKPQFETRLAKTAEDIRGAQALRYKVFVVEMGADGPLVDHDQALERDRFDQHAEQLLLCDLAREPDDQIVGVYRLMVRKGAQQAGQFYSETEFDLAPLLQSGRTLMELGRSCLHADYRGGVGMSHLWQGLAKIVRAREIEVLFGVASFHGTDLNTLSPSLSLLHQTYLAPEDIRVCAKSKTQMNSAPVTDRVAAMRGVPALIKAYLRLGGFIGDGVFVDAAFNTTDVCLILDLARMTPKQAALYGGAR